ncbi:uncharacterized protein LOC117115735 [Anneissia japonica]|uniref:uncharacterized protein LOC117115735 n=1 Tax=Anneissia japonica TaxID=1529436 RepID=UPI00142596B6|nr:uncharacterized protein LOC117115735 [Anneissia japonica]
MEETGLSKDDFSQLLVDFSRWYDGLGHVNMLKVLYNNRDHVPIYNELSEATKVISLLSMLIGSGNLSPTNLTILYDTIKVTGQFGFNSRVILPLIQRIKEHEVTKFSWYRQFLLKLGTVLTEDDIVALDVRYNIPLLKNYNDSWHLILDLEHKNELCEEKIYNFIEGLPSCLAVKYLLEGIKEASTSITPKVNEDKAGKSEQPRRSRSDEDKIIKDALTTRQKEKYRNENQMTPAVWHHHHEINIAEVFTELNLLQSRKIDRKAPDKSTWKKKEGKPTSLKDALDVIKSQDSCKILITGKGGMGKTTLLKYIANQWATDDKHVFADKLLFMMNIREIKACVKFLDIIMEKIDSNGIIIKNDLNDNSVKKFLVKHDNEIVILLDGYDELERDAKDPLDLFKGSELQKSTVVITSRPDNTADLVKCCDVHIEVKGFSPGNIKKYIHKHFESIGATEVGELLIKEFSLDSEYTMFWGDDHKEALELCSSPLLLLHICTIWKQIRLLPTYLPDLFKEIICCTLSQYLNRTGNGTAISNLDSIPDDYMPALLALGECMYEGLKKNALSLDKNDLSKNKELVNLALNFGFVYEDTPVDPGDTRKMYTPPHKLISEALAGFCLANKIQEDHLKVEEYEVIRSNEYLHMTRVFTVGFLGDKAGKLLKHWFIKRASNLCSIAQCFRHVKDEHEHHVLQELDNNSEMKACCEQICQSFRIILNDNIKNMHLFKLMCCIETHEIVELEKAPVSMIDTSSEESLRIACRDFVHSSVVVQGAWLTEHFFEYISNWGEKRIKILSAAMKNIDMTYKQRVMNFSFIPKVSSFFVIHFLEHARNLSSITYCQASVLSEVMNELHKTHTKLKLTKLTIDDLRDTDGGLLEKLFEVAPKLQYLKVASGKLSGSIIKRIKYCRRRYVVFSEHLLRKKLNLSDIDSESLATFIWVVTQSIYQSYKHDDDFDYFDYDFYNDCRPYAVPFIWSKYSLTADNLTKLVKSDVNMRLNWIRIDLSKINLSSVSGRTLACLIKISPDMRHICCLCPIFT